MEVIYLLCGELVSKLNILPCTAQAASQLWDWLEVDLLASACTNQCQLYYTLVKPLHPEAFGLNASYHPWRFQISYIFPPTLLITLMLPKLLVAYLTSQFWLLILVAECWIEAPWHPAVLNILAGIPYQCPSIKDLITDDSVGWVLKDLSLLHLTLWLLRNVCCTDKSSLLR